MSQATLFQAESTVTDAGSTTFLDNMKLPVHRWFRYSAGFSAQWARDVMRQHPVGELAVLDPFAGSGTTLLAAEELGIPSYGIEAHPFIARVARTKLLSRSDSKEYSDLAQAVWRESDNYLLQQREYPELIAKCYSPEVLARLGALRTAIEDHSHGRPCEELVWLTLVSILRKVSHANTAQWQYVLPSKSKAKVVSVERAWREQVATFSQDMDSLGQSPSQALLIQGDARTCLGVPDKSIRLVVTSPPYPNNYDYADSTRLEMSFMGEISGWGDLQQAVRQYLIRSCSQHVPESKVNLADILASPVLDPIREPLSRVCQEMAEIRKTKGGKKTYHLMVACYFLDLAQTWHALRRVCASPSRLCFVIGDSAPYGVYVPAVEWLGLLALDAGFTSYTFEQTRERNTKWKNRKHRVPLCEGRLWVEG